MFIKARECNRTTEVGASIQVTGSAEILNILSGRECGGRQVKALYIIMCEVQSEHQMKNIEYTCIFFWEIKFHRVLSMNLEKKMLKEIKKKKKLKPPRIHSKAALHW